MNTTKKAIVRCASQTFTTLILLVGGLLSNPVFAQNETPENFKIAFIGDAGINNNADAVLTLIQNEGAGAVVHMGDLGYDENTAQSFENNINGILGPDFPYFYSAGNHDARDWNISNGYRQFLEARFNRLGLPWAGDLGTKSTFSYRGIFFVATSPNEIGVGQTEAANYVRDQLAANDALWSISFWHKNQREMQVGGKGNEAGWGVYEESRRGGAIIATGHEHSYSRTYLMSHMENLQVASTSDTLELAIDDASTNADEGRSFAFVSGLGGRSIRDQELFGRDHWASIYSSTQGATHGALFGEFNYGGQADLARFYFKDIDGNIQDEFFVRAPGERYQLSTSVVGQGSVSLDPAGGSYAPGSEVTLTATPEEGWFFAGWSNDLTGEQNPATITMDADKNVTATFSEAPPGKVTLTVDIEGQGEVTVDPPGGIYDPGATVTLTATPASEWLFMGWSGDLSTDQNPISITLDENKRVVASFAPPTRALTVNVEGMGAVTLDPPGGTYEEGTSVALTAVPDPGWAFAGWSGDVTGAQNPTNLTIDADKTVTAAFSEITEEIIVENGDGEDKIEVNQGQKGAQSFLYGEAGAPDYEISRVIVFLSKDLETPELGLGVSIGTGINSGTIEGSSVEISSEDITDDSEGVTFVAVEIAFETPVGPLKTGATYFLNFENESPNGKKYYLAYSPEDVYVDGTYYKSGSDDSKDIRFQIWGGLSDEGDINTGLTDAGAIPASFVLEQNYPNPFNASTAVQYRIEEPAQVRIDVFDLQGHLIATMVDARHLPGAYTTTWNAVNETGKPLASGMYPYRITVDTGAETLTHTRMMVLLR